MILVLVQGLPHKTASEVLGCPEGTVAWRIHEARRKLRLLLASSAEPDDAGEGGAENDSGTTSDPDVAGREAS